MDKKLRFLIRVLPVSRMKEPLKFLRIVAKNLGVDAVNPKKTSYGALELDLFSEKREDIALFESVISPLFNIEFLRDLNVSEGYVVDKDALVKAVNLFNSERFWEAHEILESIWRRKEGEEKKLIQGLILVCAAYVHLQKDEHITSKGLIRRAIELVDRFDKDFYNGIDIRGLKLELERQLSSERIGIFKIKIC
jgi:hypothetical protein